VGGGGAPAPAGPYRAAVRHGDLLFCSGQIALDPEGGDLVAEGSAEEMRRCMENLAAVCREHETDLSRALRLTIYTTQAGNFPKLNEVYADFFDGDLPARAAVGVTWLPRGATVMIDAIVAAA
jgi:2-iminobutanoate/2-iminopropanoate deaminase